MTLQTGTHQFTGRILGLGFDEGTRIVVGRWTRSPYGDFTDVMVERRDGHRILLAPTQEIADTVAALYTFDEVQVVPVEATTRGRVLTLTAGPLGLSATIGERTAVGKALSMVPSALSSRAWWTRVTDPIAQALLRGVSTRGTTANGLPATYGATDVHAVTDATATWDGSDLGALVPVSPPVRFGFGSTPPEPSLTALTTTIEVPEPDPLTGVIDCWGVGALRDKQARDDAEQRDAGETGSGRAGAVDENDRRHVDTQESREVREQDEEAEVSQEARAARAEGAEGQLPTPLSDAKREGELPR